MPGLVASHQVLVLRDAELVPGSVAVFQAQVLRDQVNYFVEDWAFETIGGAPTNWTEQWNTGDFSLKVQQGEHRDHWNRHLWFDQAAIFDRPKAASYDPVGTNVISGEILTRFRVKEYSTDEATIKSMIVARASGSDGSENCYFLSLDDDLGGGPSSPRYFRLRKRISGSNTTLAEVPFPHRMETRYGTEGEPWYLARFSFVGTSLQASIWPESEAEPGSWMIDETDSDITTGGWIGMGVYESWVDMDVGFFAFSPPGFDPLIEGAGALQAVVTQHIVEVLSTPYALCRCTQMAVEVIRNVEGYKPIGGSQPIIVVVAA